jgi:non-heme chloroperoxidase
MPYTHTRDDVRLFYQDWGAGEPVVFLSAWSLSSKMWQYQMINMIEVGLRCIAYDRRGHGLSDQPGDGYDYDTLADDLGDVLDALNLDRVTLVGASMAPGEIIRYLTRWGDGRVARVAFVAPAGPFPLRAADNPDGLDPAALEALEGAWKKDFTAWMDQAADAYVGKGLPGCEVSHGLVQWTKDDMLEASLLALIACHRTATGTDLRPEVAKIAVPTLIIDGDHDASAPTEISGLVCAELIEDSLLKTYVNAPHGLHLTHRDRLSADLLEFVNGSPGHS